MSQISMSIAFLSGFALVGVHTHMLLHLSLGATGLAMVAYVINVILGLFLNLWFMAGQVFTLDMIARWEPTSCIMEWLHDSIFGISDERMAAAYTVGSKSGRRSIDGKRYVEYIVPRRTVPYPFSIGGVIHMLFFAAEDPSNPKHFIRQMLRSLTVISVIVVLTQTYITESMYHASVLYDRALGMQMAGDVEGAAELYTLVIKQSPELNPFVAAAHQTHLILSHPWAAGMYVVAARFQSLGLYDAALNAFTLVQDEAPESVLVKHPLSALRSGGGGGKGDRGDLAGTPPTREWVEAVFDGFASGYEGAMSRLAYESPRLVADAVKRAVGGRRGAVLSRAMDLGCGTGLLGVLLRGAIEGGGLIGVDVSEQMLKAAEGTGAYHSLRKDDMIDALLREHELDLIAASDSLRYLGSLSPLLRASMTALNTGGYIAFTVDAAEHAEGEGWKGSGEGVADWKLLGTGGTVHSLAYIKRLAKEMWYSVVYEATEEIRWVSGKPVMGHVVVLQRA